MTDQTRAIARARVTAKVITKVGYMGRARAKARARVMAKGTVAVLGVGRSKVIAFFAQG